MNSSPFRLIVSSVVVAVALLATPPSAQAAVDCTVPRGLEQQRACTVAAEGAESLRRFRDRTRAIYSIYMPDYAKAIAPKAGADFDRVKVARRS